MKTNLEDISSVRKKISVEIDSHVVDSKLDETYRKLGREVKIPGFRPGKAPRQILERYIGNQVAEDVARDLIDETLPKALESIETSPIGAPFLEKEILRRGQSFKYSAVMEVRPQFELKDYLGLEVEKEELSVAEDDIQNQLEQIRQAHGTLTSLEGDRPIQKNDHVLLDYEGFEERHPLEGIKASNFLLHVGSNSFHPAFEQSLVGLKRDDEAGIRVEFEDSYHHERLAGKRVDFKVKILDIKQMILPELNDDFAQSLDAEFKTLEELRIKVKETLISQEEKRIDRELKQKLLKKISDAVEFEIPQTLVESEINYAVETVKENLIRSGSNLVKAGLSEDKLRERFRLPSEKRVKDLLILGEIAEQNAITVDEEDLAEEFKAMAASTGQDVETLRQYYHARDIIGPLKEKLLEEKTLNYLAENAKILSIDKDQQTIMTSK